MRLHQEVSGEQMFARWRVALMRLTLADLVWLTRKAAKWFHTPFGWNPEKMRKGEMADWILRSDPVFEAGGLADFLWHYGVVKAQPVRRAGRRAL